MVSLRNLRLTIHGTIYPNYLRNNLMINRCCVNWISWITKTSCINRWTSIPGGSHRSKCSLRNKKYSTRRWRRGRSSLSQWGLTRKFNWTRIRCCWRCSRMLYSTTSFLIRLFRTYVSSWTKISPWCNHLRTLLRGSWHSPSTRKRRMGRSRSPRMVTYPWWGSYTAFSIEWRSTTSMNWRTWWTSAPWSTSNNNVQMMTPTSKPCPFGRGSPTINYSMISIYLFNGEPCRSKGMSLSFSSSKTSWCSTRTVSILIKYSPLQRVRLHDPPISGFPIHAPRYRMQSRHHPYHSRPIDGGVWCQRSDSWVHYKLNRVDTTIPYAASTVNHQYIQSGGDSYGQFSVKLIIYIYFILNYEQICNLKTKTRDFSLLVPPIIAGWRQGDSRPWPRIWTTIESRWRSSFEREGSCR